MIRLRAPLFLLVAFVLAASTIAADEGPAKDVPELHVLNNYLGEWDVEVTSKDDAPFGAGTFVGQSSASWTLDGRFLQRTSWQAHANDSKPLKTTMLMTYDEKKKTCSQQTAERIGRFAFDGIFKLRMAEHREDVGTQPQIKRHGRGLPGSQRLVGKLRHVAIVIAGNQLLPERAFELLGKRQYRPTV